MTTYAIANIMYVQMFIPDPFGNNTKQVVYHLELSVDGGPPQIRGQAAYVPLSLSAKKADEFIRKHMADDALQFLGVTIDPDDIYIPFAGR